MTAESLCVEQLTETHLLEYIRHVRECKEAERPPAARSINLRLLVIRLLFGFCNGRSLPSSRSSMFPEHESSSAMKPLGYGYVKRRRTTYSKLKVKVPSRVIIPLSRRDVARFFDGLRTWRDLSLVSLMLLSGLRSCEVVEMKVEDLSLIRGEVRTRGKGDKDRVVPLAAYSRLALMQYHRLERPETEHDFVFVNLKGRTRQSNECGRAPRPLSASSQTIRYSERQSSSVQAHVCYGHDPRGCIPPRPQTFAWP